jgi:adenylosuccinate synthase
MKIVRVCVGYNINGKETLEIPFDHDISIEPVYSEFSGWNEDISQIREYSDLPLTLKQFIDFIEIQTGIPVTMVSVGPDRKQTILR